MENSKSIPSAEKILSTLIELYADQMGVKATYEIEGRENDVLHG